MVMSSLPGGRSFESKRFGPRGILIVLLISVASCSFADRHDATSDSKHTATIAGVTVTVPQGAFGPGREVSIKKKPLPASSSEFVAEPVVEIAAGGGKQPALPL